MEKVYLKYDDIRPYVECDYGTVWEMIYLGPFYPLKKKDYKFFILILILQIAISTVMLILIPTLSAGIIASIIMIFAINLLFALNYNMIIIEYLLKEGYVPMDYQSSDKLIKKGIYFKLQ